MQDNLNQYDTQARRHGPWLDYHDNGQLWYKGEYVHGQVQGPWIIYAKNGQISIKATYDTIYNPTGYFISFGYSGSARIEMKRFYAR